MNKKEVNLDKIPKEETPMSVLRKPDENSHNPYMANIKKIAQEAIQKKGLTEEQVRKILGIRRYEKDY